MKTLVLYFSASNRTARLAKELADYVQGELLEIRPQEIYTPGDLNWVNPLARCNREKLAKKDVSVQETDLHLQDYDMVFLGFPIWYGGAPNVVNTFVKAFDWKEKTVAAFATSGGGGLGRTRERLLTVMPGARILDAKLLKPGDEAPMQSWASEMLATAKE